MKGIGHVILANFAIFIDESRIEINGADFGRILKQASEKEIHA